jgi:hypothetical protein
MQAYDKLSLIRNYNYNYKVAIAKTPRLYNQKAVLRQ